MVLEYIRITEEDTTSSSRIFVKILFQELAEYLGLPKFVERLKDASMQEHFEGRKKTQKFYKTKKFLGIFPKDNPRNTRFAINFFTSIGLGGITDGMREWLKNAPKMPIQEESESESER